MNFHVKPPPFSEKMLKRGIWTVILVWVFYAQALVIFFDFENFGQLGDAFGALNTLFTGLAFAGLLAGFWHERERTQQQTDDADDAKTAAMKQAALTAQANRNLLEAMTKQALVAAHSGKLNATIAKRSRIFEQMKITNAGEERNDLNRAVMDLDKQIDQMVDNFPT